jgi:hypothetical protein
MSNHKNTQQSTSKKGQALSLLLAVVLSLLLLPAAAFANPEADAIIGADEFSSIDSKVQLPEVPASPAAPVATAVTGSSGDETQATETDQIPSVTAQANVCAIGSVTFSTLDSALVAFRDGDTIKLLTDIEYYRSLTHTDGSLTIETNGCVLNIRVANSHAIQVSNAELLLDDSAGGSVNAYCSSDSHCAVFVTGNRSNVFVSSAFGRLFGAYADEGQIVVKGIVSVNYDSPVLDQAVGVMANNGARITVYGDIVGVNFGAYAENSGQIFARRNVSATLTNPDTGAVAAMTRGNCTIEILGNATGVNYGTYAENGYIYVGGNSVASKQNSERSGIGAAATEYGFVNVIGNVEGVYCGAYSQTASVTVQGSSLSVNTMTDMAGYGAVATAGGQTTINGNVTASCTAARAYDYGSCVLVRGFASCPRIGVSASDRAKVQVDSHVPNSGYRGVEVARGATAFISGTVTGAIGIYADGEDSEVYVTGSVSSNESCVFVDNGATVTVDGELSAGSGAAYVTVDQVAKASTNYQRVSTNPGYLEYSQSGSFVWVRTPGITTGAPGSGDLNGDGYVTLDEALIIVRVVAGVGMHLSVEQFAAVNMDSDSQITMTDVMIMVRRACGL